MAVSGIRNLRLISRQCQFLGGFRENLQVIVFLPSTRNMATEKCGSDDKQKDSPPITPIGEARRFMIDCLVAVGTPKKHAETVADNLIEADYRGHYSHGMNRLEMYLKDIQGKLCDPAADPTIEKETVATALLNGNNGMGAVVGKFGMDLAIKKAKDVGIGMVVVHGSNHYGIAGMYTLQAINEGLLGLSFTDTSPLMAPTRAKGAALGTNPISLGAPACDGDSFVLDMATTAVAVGKIELQKRKGLPIPAGWALNKDGEMETNAEIAYDAHRLCPLGGSEITSGYKGFGLAMLVEVLTGILGGACYGPNIRKWGDSTKTANLGQSFVAIDPTFFADGFESRMSDLMNTIRKMEPASSDKPVLIAGDPERQHMEHVSQVGGLSYVHNQHDTNAKLAEKLKVKPMQSFKAMDKQKEAAACSASSR